MNNQFITEQRSLGSLAFDIWMIIRTVCSRDPYIRYSSEKSFDSSTYANDKELVSLIEPYQEYKAGRLSEADFFELLRPVAISFRNDAMRNKEDNIEKLHTAEEIATAEEGLVEYKKLADQLIAWKIGHVPDLIYSAREKLALRIIIMSLMTENPHRSISDCARATMAQQFITRMQFREVVAKEGWEAADKLPLLWFDRDEIIKEIQHL